MKQYSETQIRNIALLGHGGSGKTTLADAILFYGKATERIGKISDSTTVMDFDAEEKKRKTSVSTAVYALEINDNKLNLIDAPGLFDFAAGVSEALAAADSAIIAISGKSGLTVGAKQCFEKARALKKSVGFFVGKLDSTHAHFYRVLSALAGQYGAVICPVVVPYIEGEEVKSYINLIENKAYGCNGLEIKEMRMPVSTELDDMRSMLLEAIASADLYLSREIYSKGNVEEISEILVKNMMAVYNRRMNVIIQRTLPILKSIAPKEGVNMPDDAKIRIPVTDGRKVYGVLVNIKKTIESEGRELVRAISKSITLWQIDEKWKEHLRDMDDLKQSVQNATYEQKDPLLIYKFESFNLFSEMLEELNKDVLSFLLRAFIPLRDASEAKAPAPQQPKRNETEQMTTSRTDLVTNGGEQKSKMPVHVDKQVGRNDPCPCGSGKKFKNCHGKGL